MLLKKFDFDSFSFQRNRVLPIEIQGLMGEANLAYARGETNKAIDICIEVIGRLYIPKIPQYILSLSIKGYQICS